MLRRRERTEERRIGRVGGLERAVGKISLVAEPVRPRLTIDENGNVERILRAEGERSYFLPTRTRAREKPANPPVLRGWRFC
jgi:hypothetical protein